MRFTLGKVLGTPGALRHLSPVTFTALVLRHSMGNWGVVVPEDAQANEEAIRMGARILSVYVVRSREDGSQQRIYVITEADRSATTVLLAEEY